MIQDNNEDPERRVLLHRATTAMYWGMPAIAMQAAWRAMIRDVGAQNLEVQSFSQPIQARHAMLTGNSLIPFCTVMIDLREGAVVVEVPAATSKAMLVGTANDFWQIPIVDFGPRGDDQGRGARFLFLPPDFTGAVPDGYRVETIQTYRLMLVVRPVPINGATMAEANAYARGLKIYRLADAANPPPTKFIDPFPKAIDSLPHYDASLFRTLAEVIEIEPLRPQDAALVGTLARLGIEKGKPFKPDASTERVFDQAAQLGYEMLQHDFTTPGRATVSYWPGSPWSRVNIGEDQLAKGFPFFDEGRTLIDERANYFFWILGTFKHYSKPPAVYYLTSVRDQSGELLDGTARYQLHVPADVPAGQFWAVTVYSLQTKSLIPTASRAGLSSYDPLRKEPDGSVNLYFGGSSADAMDSNWLPTGEPFFVVFRFYGAAAPLFDGSWQMDGLEKA